MTKRAARDAVTMRSEIQKAIQDASISFGLLKGFSRSFSFQRLAVCSASCLVLLASGRLQAAGAAIPVRVFVEAPVGCPTADDFVREMASHAPAYAARADEAAHTLLVRIERTERDFRGSLESRSTSGVDQHHVIAEDCRDLTAVLALSAAMTLEGRPAPSPDREELPPPTEPGRTPEEPALGDAATKPGETSDPEPEGAAPGARSPGTEVLAEAGARLLFGGYPTSPGPFLGLGVREEGGAGLGARVRVAFGFPLVATEEVSFWLTEVAVLGCYEQVPVGPLFLRGCLSTAMGPLIAEGQGLALEETTVLFSGRSGVELGAQAPLGRSWHLALSAGVDFVWSRPQAVVAPTERVVLEAGPVAGTFGLGIERVFE